ncbi:hypothetical protein [Methanosphaerula palustris]|uniref:hypothetical protein n=1 Tax=Methanosphaerula palustris TaxID=475088 RepID=UPI00032182B8|nr:hypothetical protein [Methanosphaerula palustris]
MPGRTVDRLLNPAGPVPLRVGNCRAPVDTDLPDQPRLPSQSGLFVQVNERPGSRCADDPGDQSVDVFGLLVE